MAKLNDKNEVTQKIVHLVITEKCDRDCKYCCNKQYDMNTIPFATVEELNVAEMVFLTGGEPFAYSSPNEVAKSIKEDYNVPKVFVYSNALELADYLNHGGDLNYIDGITISIKIRKDLEAFQNVIMKNDKVKSLQSNRLYVFGTLYPEDIEKVEASGFKVSARKWQSDFTPAQDSIFRRDNIFGYLEKE